MHRIENKLLDHHMQLALFHHQRMKSSTFIVSSCHGISYCAIIPLIILIQNLTLETLVIVYVVYIYSLGCFVRAKLVRQ